MAKFVTADEYEKKLVGCIYRAAAEAYAERVNHTKSRNGRGPKALRHK